MLILRADSLVATIYSQPAPQAGEVEGHQMSDATSIIFVVDDDVSVRES